MYVILYLYIGMIGHDIRQPLCSVQVCSEMLASQIWDRDDSLHELVENIQSSAEFMSFLMDNLLHVSKASANNENNNNNNNNSNDKSKDNSDEEDEKTKKQSYNRKLVDPITIIGRNVLVNTRLAARKQIGISLEIEESLLKYQQQQKQQQILGTKAHSIVGSSMNTGNSNSNNGNTNSSGLLVSIDVFGIEQVLNNLISNAIKFSFPRSNIRVSVSRSTTKPNNSNNSSNDKSNPSSDEDFLVVSVKDQGQGIAEDELPYVLNAPERLTTQPTGYENSTKLGLSIVKDIISQHGGTIRVESKLNEGSTFSFTLPLANPNKKKIKNNSSSFDTASPALSDKPGILLSILVAEDNPMNRKLVHQILTKRGHSVTATSNGKEAIEEFQQQRMSGNSYDIILLDHEMPVMDGIEASKRIREIDPQVPIISMSGSSSPELEQLQKENGITQWIIKPFKVKQLLRVVENSYAADLIRSNSNSNNNLNTSKKYINENNIVSYLQSTNNTNDSNYLSSSSSSTVDTSPERKKKRL